MGDALTLASALGHPAFAGVEDCSGDFRPFDIRWRQAADEGFLKVFRSIPKGLDALHMIARGETSLHPCDDWTPERVWLFLEKRDWIAIAIQPLGPLREAPDWSWSLTEMDSGMIFQFIACGPPLHVVLERLEIIGAADTGKHRDVNHL